jgi:hypothetical protein
MNFKTMCICEDNICLFSIKNIPTKLNFAVFFIIFIYLVLLLLLLLG